MKRFKKFFTVFIALMLTFAMAAGLSGCGGEDKDDGKENKPNSETQQNTNPDFVYVPAYTTIDYKTDRSFSNAYFSGDSFYVQSYEVIGNETPEGVTPEYEGQYDIYGAVLYKVGLDGKCEKLNYTPPQIEEGVDGSAGVNNIQLAPDGSMYVLENIYTYWSDAPEEVEEYSDEWYNYYNSSEKYQIRHFSPEMEELGVIDLSTLTSGEENGYFYPYGFVIDDAGNIYIAADMYLFVLDSTGKELFRVEAENWIEGVSRLPDGTVVCSNYGSSGYQLSKVDFEAKSLGENIELPNNAQNIIVGGGDYDFYYSNNISLFGYDTETGESTKLINWLSIGVDNYNLGKISILDDGRVAAVQTEWDEDYVNCTNEIMILTKQPASSVPEKKSLTLATMSLNYDVRSAIIDFNKTNSEYRIDVLDYSEYNTEEDYSAGLTKLTTEILTGNMPDILDLNGMPEAQLASKELLEDLYPYLEKDSELSKEDLFPSVLASLESNGKLYRTCSSFYVQTVLGASSVVGDTPGWTVDEFNAALATMPEGCTAFDAYVTRSEIINSCLALDINSFVNWETGECNFNSEGFIKLLEFVKSFPSEFDWENYDWEVEGDTPERISSGKQMLVQTSLSDFTDFKMYKAMFGGKVTCIGFPTEYGTGNMIGTNSGYAMSSKSENKDAVWTFLRQFFAEDYQNEMYGFPINMNAFNKKLEKAMTPEYEKDADGNYILDENGNKIEVSHGGWSWGSITVEMTAVTQEEADQILDLINTTTKSMKTDESISKIILEEAAAYFEGQKSAEEVAKMIQSKVNLYVNEQR